MALWTPLRLNARRAARQMAAAAEVSPRSFNQLPLWYPLLLNDWASLVSEREIKKEHSHPINRLLGGGRARSWRPGG